MIRLVIHAPTQTSLERGRRNLANLLKAEPDAQVELVINAEAVRAALDTPHPLDRHLRVCSNTLVATGLQPPPDIVQVAAAVLHIAQRQHEGWAYLRA